MRRILIACLMILPYAAVAQTPPAAPAPSAGSFALQGVAYADPYRAMQEDFSAFEKWRAEETDYAEAVLRKAPLRQKLFERIKALDAAEAYSTAPNYAGGAAVFLRTDGQSYNLYRQRDGEEPQLILKADDLGEGRNILPSTLALSPDGRILAYGVARNGEADPSFEFLDLEKNTRLPQTIDDPLFADAGGFYGAFTPDSKYFLFARNPLRTEATPEKEREYHGHVYAWRLDSPVSEAKALFGDSITPGVAAEDTPYVKVSSDGAWLVVWLRRPTDREIHVAPLRAALSGKPAFRKIAGLNPPGAGYDVWDDTLYVGRLDKGDNGVIESYNLKEKRPKAETAFLPAGGSLARFAISNGVLHVALRRAGGFDLVRVRGGVAEPIALPFDGSIDALQAHEGGGVSLRMGGWTTPKTNMILGADDAAPRLSFVRAANAGGGAFISERTEALARDGTLVPISVLRSPDQKRDGRNLVYMNVYGCYGNSLDPDYWAAVESILETGAMVAIAHVRGGAELGGSWYAAQRARKGVNWEDAIDAARHLVDQNWTSQGLIAIEGASCGGAVVANAALDQPELFGAAVLSVPALDWVGGIDTPAGARATDEDVTTALGARKVIAFSPYHRIRAGARRPAIMIAVGANDYTIPLWDSAKFVARQRRADRADAPPLVWRINETGGHAVADGESAAAELADSWAFALWAVGENRRRLAPVSNQP